MSTVVYSKGRFYSDSKVTTIKEGDMTIRQSLEMAEKALRGKFHHKYIEAGLQCKVVDGGYLAHGGKWVIPANGATYRGGEIKAIALVGSAANFLTLESVGFIEGDFEMLLKEQMGICLGYNEKSQLMIATDIGVYITDFYGEPMKFIDYDDQNTYAIGSGAYDFYDTNFKYFTDETLEGQWGKEGEFCCRVSDVTAEQLIVAASHVDKYTNDDVRVLSLF